MNIEELAFKDRKDLAQLNEKDLLDIIEFLQNDRKQWINQFSKTHNESIDIKKENEQLKDNWNKLKEYIEKDYGFYDKLIAPEYGCAMGALRRIKDKMQELKQGSDSK